MNEADTRAEYIDKQLEKAGWITSAETGVRVRREYNINAGEIRSSGIRTGQLKADYILEYKNTKLAVVEEAALPARVNQHVAIIRPLENTVLPNYLAYLLVSKTYKDLLLRVGEGGGATRQAITKAEIEQFRISYPSSIDEQASIVHKFDNLREQALQLKAIYNQQTKNFQSLKSAILADELQSEAA